AMFNSRDYQDRRENLYLVALPVTAQRFSFAAQFFATEQAVYIYAGRLASGGGVGTGVAGGTGSGVAGGALGATPSSMNQWSLNRYVVVAQLFPTGAVLLYKLANQTVWNLTSGAHQSLSSISNMSLDIAQPLLRGGGRAVTLEPLTQAERNLLYEIRSYARFRKEFFVAIPGGRRGSTGGPCQPVGVLRVSRFSEGAGLGNSGLSPGLTNFTAATGLVVLRVLRAGWVSERKLPRPCPAFSAQACSTPRSTSTR